MNKLEKNIDTYQQASEGDTPHIASSFNVLVLDNLPAAIGVIDRQGNLIYANATWERYISEFDTTKQELVNNVYPDLCQIADEVEAGRVQAGVDEVLRAELSEFSFELLCPFSDQERWFKALVSPIVQDCSIVAATVMHIDITDRKRAELQTQLALQEKQTVIDEKQKILDMSLDLICSFDEEGRFVQVNSACRDILGYEPEELVGVPYLNMVYEADHGKMREARIVVGEDMRNFENRYVRKDGTLVHLLWTARWDEEDRRYFCIGRDISVNKRAEEQKDTYNKKISTILNSITDGFYTVNKDWIVTYWNKKAEQITGLSRKDALDKCIWELFPGATQMKYYTEYHRAVSEQVPVHFVERSSVKNLWLDVSAYPSEEGLSVYSKDITARKLADEQVRIANERYEIVTRVTQDAIWDYDVATNKATWGGGFGLLFGYDMAKEVTNMEAWISKIHPDDLPWFMDGYAQSFQQPDVNQFEATYRAQKSDGTYATVLGRGFIVRDQDGNPTRIVGAIQDITRHIEREQEREKLIKELSQANAELKQFTYITSHNFRAPLSNLLGLLDLMKAIPIEDPMLAEIIEGFRKSTTALHETVNDLIQVLITKGNPSQSKEQLSIREVFDKVYHQIRISVEEAGTEIQYDDQLAPMVYFDRSYLESILLNLLTNSVKYRSYQRALRINITTRDTGDSVQLLFSDNGIGMDLDRYRDRLFGLYQRFHDRPDSKGLGLYLVKSQIEALGGSIDVESQVDQGTTFTITFTK
ncbi:PAS domain S-box protein [Telluribacter humicola]|uniref:PAS domain S-box protein n=1 Tax=Telluribacter humicola TaxID=1720261 RepID=UPI001A9679A8|nr:PAS domain S-box protein [Telluribacter humicola]